MTHEVCPKYGGYSNCDTISKYAFSTKNYTLQKNIIKERITTTPVGDQGYKGVGKHAKSKVAHIEQKHKKNK